MRVFAVMSIRTYRVAVWPKVMVTEFPATAGLNVYVADATMSVNVDPLVLPCT